CTNLGCIGQTLGVLLTFSSRSRAKSIVKEMLCRENNVQVRFEPILTKNARLNVNHRSSTAEERRQCPNHPVVSNCDFTPFAQTTGVEVSVILRELEATSTEIG